ncbi:Uncharacterised protein [Mycobacteroides abscessus subsp. massiliense]|nr:Uncharacterised protein [Mycobacteroides abscessus subsp. massiliense]
MQAARPARVHSLGGLAPGVLVAGAAPDALIAAGAECPAAVLGAGAVPGEQHRPDIGGHPGVVQGSVELIDGVRPEGIAHLGPVERDPDGPLADVPVIGDVGQILESRHRLPASRVKGIGGLPVVLGHGSDSRGRPMCGRSTLPVNDYADDCADVDVVHWVNRPGGGCWHQAHLPPSLRNWFGLVWVWVAAPPKL